VIDLNNLFLTGFQLDAPLSYVRMSWINI